MNTLARGFLKSWSCSSLGPQASRLLIPPVAIFAAGQARRLRSQGRARPTKVGPTKGLAPGKSVRKLDSNTPKF